MLHCSVCCPVVTASTKVSWWKNKMRNIKKIAGCYPPITRSRSLSSSRDPLRLHGRPIDERWAFEFWKASMSGIIVATAKISKFFYILRASLQRIRNSREIFRIDNLPQEYFRLRDIRTICELSKLFLAIERTSEYGIVIIIPLATSRR